MRFHLYTRRLPATLLAALACAAAATTGISASGQSPTLQVTMESLIYDLKNPDAPRRLAAARSLRTRLLFWGYAGLLLFVASVHVVQRAVRAPPPSAFCALAAPLYIPAWRAERARRAAVTAATVSGSTATAVAASKPAHPTGRQAGTLP